MQVTNIKKLQKKSLKLTVTPTADPHIFGVQSGTDPDITYIVTFGQGYHEATCTCPWMQNGGNVCCHILAAVRLMAKNEGNRVSFWLIEVDAKRQKKRMETVNGIWVTVRKWEVRMKEEQKQEQPVWVYECDMCGEEHLAAPGQTGRPCWKCREGRLVLKEVERAA